MSQILFINDIRNEPLNTKVWDFVENVQSQNKSDILITGANSFLGTHIVKILQQKWQGKIHLIVRGENQQSAILKMKTAYNLWNLGNFETGDNTEIYCGEVCQPQMGLSNKIYDELYTNVGFVLPLAMVPLYHLPYSRYKSQWLPELEEMIKFCRGDHIKSLHYPSSYNANFFTVDEDFKQINSNCWQSGYAGFKWVANRVIENAFNQGLKGCIYDIPLVVGSLKNGLCPENYSIWHILDLFLQTGYFIPYIFKIIPIDVLSEIIVSNLMEDKKGNGEQFIRPALNDPITHTLFQPFATALFGLKLTNRETMYNASVSKRRFCFMIPENFNALLEKVNNLPSVMPANEITKNLPNPADVFFSNINAIFSKPKYQKHIQKAVNNR